MPFQIESPDSMRSRNTKQNFLQGIAKSITDYSNIQAEKAKIQGQIAVNRIKQSDNLIYKIQEQKAMRDENIAFAKQMQGVFGGGQDGQQDEVTAPKMGFGTDMQPTFSQPSTADKTFAIKQGWARVEAKQARGMELSPAETNFMEKYPKSMLGGTQGKSFVPNEEVTQKVIKNIKSSEDLQDLLKNKEAYKEAGVDIGAVIKAHLDTAKKDPGIWENIMKFFQ